MYIYFIQLLLLLALRKIFPDSHIDSALIIKKKDTFLDFVQSAVWLSHAVINPHWLN